MNNHKYYSRFTVFARLQHFVLFMAVFCAIITGLPMKFPEQNWAVIAVKMVGGMEMRAWLHHAAGLVIIFVGLLHFIYYFFLDWKTPFYKRPIIPRARDFSDFYHHMKYIVGLDREKPQMGYYTWYEKLDYFGAIWGISVMGITGLAMLYMDEALHIMPMAWLQVLWAIHTEEAMLAILFLFFIHMYHVHFSRDNFPMSLTWINGLTSEEHMNKLHGRMAEEGHIIEPVSKPFLGGLQKVLDVTNRKFAKIAAIIGVLFWATISYLAIRAVL